MSQPDLITQHLKTCPFCDGEAWSVAKDQHGGWIYECDRCTDVQYGVWPKWMTEKYDFCPDKEMDKNADGTPASCGASCFGTLSIPLLFNEKGNKVT